ncbi:MAG: AAA family ATPase [Deltaproteobacteria bacterium]|jgi:DNA sulfur modification protein DndD|nr:AAA family ATPase [Deltaproteobacteria bacterium]
MKLHRIELNNFRQFKGTQTIEFSSSSTKNVSVVYGENGRGKTGIFRALMFCLYGDRSLSQDELSGEKKREGLILVNEVLLKESKGDKIQASVSIKFIHSNQSFLIKRSISGLMKPDGSILQNYSDQVELQLTDSNSNTLPKETDPVKVKIQIQEVLNSRLRDYFLFDGERIERLTRNTQERREEVRKGIRTLLDLDSMDLAINGLDKLISKIEKDIKYKSTGKLQRITELIDELNTKIDDLKNKQQQDTQEIKRLEHHIKKISGLISENEETASQERKRQGLIKIMHEKKIERDETKNELAVQLNSSCQIVASELIEQLQEELDLHREKGLLPPDIRKEFVEKLLAEEECICGSPLDQHHPSEREKLLSFMERYFKPGLGKESEEILRKLNVISSTNELLSNAFNRLLMKSKRLNDEINELESKIKILGDELGEGGTSVDDLIQERSKCEEDQRELEREIDRSEDQIKKDEEKREELRKDAVVLEKQQSHLTNLAAKRDLTKDTLMELKIIYDKFADEIKIKLADKSTENFSKLADAETLKDIKTINIDENYMLDVLNWAGQRRLGEISAGQRQIVSLAFIISLIQIAGDLEVPLFMDTPFGRLSGKHRDHLIETIPRMASQWILLATDTEFTAVEANVLRQTNTWGKIYELQKEEEGVTKIIERQVNEFTPKRKSIY